MVKHKRKKHPKKRTAAFKTEEPRELVEAPHTFVIRRGLPCMYINYLTHDVRRIMEPFTAKHLRESKMNRIKDFVAVSSYFHVSHMCIFNKSSTQLSFKVLRLPKGPTLSFKVHQFTLARDIISHTKKQYVDEAIFKHSPLVVMNNFSGEGNHIKLMANTFQNMFPAINLVEVNIATIRRCVLFSYNPETKLIEMRHYSIQVTPVGLTRGIKKLVLGNIPNMSKCSDISEYIMNDGNVSESEAEEDTDLHVTLPKTLNRKGNLEDNKSAIKLYEIGPRLTLQLMKIEEGLLTGEVLYHDNIVKSEEEKEQQRKLIEKKRRLKELRRQEQAKNLKKKEEEKNKLKKTKQKEFEEEGKSTKEVEDDDIEYYRNEVGEEPDEVLFQYAKTTSKEKSNDGNSKNKQKARIAFRKRPSTSKSATDTKSSSFKLRKVMK